MEFIKYNFGPELLKTNVDLNLCSELLNAGKNQMSIDSKLDSITFNSSYYYNSETLLSFKDRIIVYIEKYINEVSKIRNLKPYDFKYHLEDLWINFQKSKDFNAPHTHSSDISFVIYVDMPEKIQMEHSVKRGFKNGSISFLYGQNLKKSNINSSEFNSIVNSYISPITQISHLPSTGEMFIFPSYLMHYVAPFFSIDVDRVSVAGNINLINNNKKTLL